MDVLLDCTSAQLVHHLQSRRNHPRGDDRTDCLGACFDAGEVHQHRPNSGRVLGEPHTHLGGDAAHALTADERAAQVVAGRVGLVAAQLHDLAIGQHDLHPQHVRRRDPVGEAVRPSRVVGDVATNRTALLAAGVGGEVQPVLRHGPGEIEVEHTGLDPGQSVDGIDRQDPIHLGRDNQDCIVEWRGTTGETGSGATSHERSAMSHGDPNAGLHLDGGRGEANDAGMPLEVRRIAPVQRQLGLTDPNPIGRQRGAQVVDE